MNKTINPDEAIASDAAVLAAFLNGEKSEVFKYLVLFDLFPFALGDGVKLEHHYKAKHCRTCPSRSHVRDEYRSNAKNK